MRALLLLAIPFFTLFAHSQTIEMAEATDEELKEIISMISLTLKQSQEDYYDKSKLWGFEYVIYYEDKPLFRGDILKPYFAGQYGFLTHSNNEYALKIKFLIPLDGLDRETQLQLREHEDLRLINGSDEKKYVAPKQDYTLVRNTNYKDEFTSFKKLADKVDIKIYKTVLKN